MKNKFYSIACLAVERKLKHKSFQLISTPQIGSSGSEVYIFKNIRTNKLLSAKCAQSPRVPFILEKKRKRKLDKYLNAYLPKNVDVYQVGTVQVMLSSTTGTNTLDQLIKQYLNRYSFEVWKDVLDKIYKLWKESAKTGFVTYKNPRNHNLRCIRVYEGIYNLKLSGIKVSDYFFKPLIINGEEYPSFAEMLKEAENISLPSFHVLCHGDPQPSNIVAGDKNWYFVDWEWSGEFQDWRTMFSHLFGWWSCNYFIHKSETRVKIQEGKLALSYNTVFPENILKFQQETLPLFYKMTTSEKVTNDLSDVNRFLITLYLGEARWRKEEDIIPLIGSAARITSKLINNRIGLKNMNSIPTKYD